MSQPKSDETPAVNIYATVRESPEDVRQAMQLLGLAQAGPETVRTPTCPEIADEPPSLVAVPPARPAPPGKPPRPARQAPAGRPAAAPAVPQTPPPRPAEQSRASKPAEAGPPPNGQTAACPPAPPFRPACRPPMALLCVLDDGREEGEWVRLREDRCVLGRTVGDVRVAHDGLISDPHAELYRRFEQGRHRWVLRDLDSTNGTYVRVHALPLRHEQELLLGSRRYRFLAPAPGAAAAPPVSGESLQETVHWADSYPPSAGPALVELTPHGLGRRFALTGPEHWLGRDAAACSIVVADDPLVSPRHAHLYQEADGGWHLRNAKSENGIWSRVEELAIDNLCRFRLGEQLFFVKVL